MSLLDYNILISYYSVTGRQCALYQDNKWGHHKLSLFILTPFAVPLCRKYSHVFSPNNLEWTLTIRMHFSQRCSYFLHVHTQRDRQFVRVVDPDHVLWIINQMPQFTPSSWGRLWDIKRACDWLPAVFVCTKKKCGNAVSAPPWHSTLMQSQVPSYHQTCCYPMPQLYLSWTLS